MVEHETSTVSAKSESAPKQAWKNGTTTRELELVGHACSTPLILTSNRHPESRRLPLDQWNVWGERLICLLPHLTCCDHIDRRPSLVNHGPWRVFNFPLAHDEVIGDDA